MDEIVTAKLAIFFNGGCRAKDVCMQNPAGTWRRGNVVSCIDVDATLHERNVPAGI